MIKRFKKSYLRLVLLVILNFTAGIHMMVSPETVNMYVIRLVGLAWFIEGCSYFIKILKKYFKGSY